MERLISIWELITDLLDRVGNWLPQLMLRLILAWEFWEAGVQKFTGDNWFSGVQENFPFPFNVIPVNFSWFLATWAELLGALGLLFGLATRFWAITLLILTVVAALAVHVPQEWSSLGELWKGYRVSSSEFGNFKLPLLFFIMLLPLLFSGPGKASIDHLISRSLNR